MSNNTKVTRSIALDKAVADSAAKAAAGQRRSFSNYVETILASAKAKDAAAKASASTNSPT